jgi:hypothetical protein
LREWQSLAARNPPSTCSPELATFLESSREILHDLDKYKMSLKKVQPDLIADKPTTGASSAGRDPRPVPELDKHLPTPDIKSSLSREGTHKSIRTHLEKLQTRISGKMSVILEQEREVNVEGSAVEVVKRSNSTESRKAKFRKV